MYEAYLKEAPHPAPPPEALVTLAANLAQLHRLAAEELERGNTGKAQDYLHEAIGLDSMDAQSWQILANIQMDMGNFAAAVEMYRRIEDCGMPSAESLAAHALALKLNQEPNAAKRLALAALELDPHHVTAQKVLARIQIDWGNHELAEAICAEILAQDPSDANAQALHHQCQRSEPTLPVPTPANGAGYDCYISLGYNCEAGLQFQRIGHDEGHFFRFTFAPLDTMLSLLRNDFSGVFARQNLVPLPQPCGMVMDSHYDIKFHSNLHSITDQNSGRIAFSADYDFDELYGLQEAPKIRYLVAKWRALTSSKQQVLYFIKLEGADYREKALLVRNTFRHLYPDHPGTICCLQTIDPNETDWGISGLINRYLPRFAPIDNAHDADLLAWDRLFTEFPLKQTNTSG